MKKYLAMICAAMLCVCCLALAACGGGSGSAASASGSASGSAAASSSAATADSAVGTWKLAAIESQGITISGNFSMFLGSDEDISLTIEKDGKASMSLGSDSVDMTWEGNGSEITLKKTESSSSSSASASASSSSSSSNPFFDNSSSSSSDEIKATIKDDALFINIEQDGQKMSMIFTSDGTYADATVIDVKKADKITNESDLVGEWKLSGMDMMGISMYGDPADLTAMMGSTGSSTDTTVKFEAGGKAKLMGEDCTYKVDSNGATITMSGQSLPIKKLGDDIVIDFTDLYSMEFAFAFSK